MEDRCDGDEGGGEEQDRSLYQDEHQQGGRLCVDLNINFSSQLQFTLSHCITYKLSNY